MEQWLFFRYTFLSFKCRCGLTCKHEVHISEFDSYLDELAKEYYEEPCGDIRDYIDQIKECNNLDSSDRITEGCYLCVPVYTENVR